MEPKTPRKRGPVKEYEKRVSLYMDREGYDLLEQLADRRKIGFSAVLRQLVQEEASRAGVRPD